MPSMHTAEPSPPGLRILPAGTPDTHAVVLILHGGKSDSTARVRPLQLAYLRMLPFARTTHAAVSGAGAAVWLLRNRVRGWNEPQLDPVRDARWALTEVERRHPGARVVLVGHSMGGRVALRLAGAPAAHTVCALAPWTQPGDPVTQLSGRGVSIAHGDRDRVTPGSTSRAYVRRAAAAGIQIERVEIEGSGHAMLRRAGVWTAYVRDRVTAAVRRIVEGQSRSGR